MATTPATARRPIAARELRETLIYTFALAHWEGEPALNPSRQYPDTLHIGQLDRMTVGHYSEGIGMLHPPVLVRRIIAMEESWLKLRVA